MEDLFVGDRITLTFDELPRNQIIATVSGMFSDIDEGFGPEIEDYVACWLQIRCGVDRRGAINNVVLTTNGQYLLDGRFVTIRKAH